LKTTIAIRREALVVAATVRRLTGEGGTAREVREFLREEVSE
jgi:hypothetical protein